jgi:hypothetical protein
VTGNVTGSEWGSDLLFDFADFETFQGGTRRKILLFRAKYYFGKNGKKKGKSMLSNRINACTRVLVH